MANVLAPASVCLACRYHSPNSLYCPSCGAIQIHMLAERSTADPTPHWLITHFPKAARLQLHLGDSKLPFISCVTQPLLIAKPSRPILSEIDFSGVHALDKGISKYHARIFRRDDSLFVTDLGSDNGSFLNGHRLEPTCPYQIRNHSTL